VEALSDFSELLGWHVPRLPELAPGTAPATLPRLHEIVGARDSTLLLGARGPVSTGAGIRRPHRHETDLLQVSAIASPRNQGLFLLIPAVVRLIPTSRVP
jgi:hypothetical protein